MVAEDGDLGDAFAQLEVRRTETLMEERTLQDDFKWTLLQGKWQETRTGRNIYGYRVDCRKATLPFLLAVAFSMKKSASFEENLYGQEGSSL
eukprot:4356481-Amphidinium_carterae.1